MSKSEHGYTRKKEKINTKDNEMYKILGENDIIKNELDKYLKNQTTKTINQIILKNITSS